MTGIIVADPSSDIYALSLEHEIEEVEPFATVIERSNAPLSVLSATFQVMVLLRARA